MIQHKAHRQRKETPQDRPPVKSIDTQDRVDEASYDSFPASDPPSHAGGHDRGGDPIPPGKPVRKSKN